jgi:hypothetical protein
VAGVSRITGSSGLYSPFQGPASIVTLFPEPTVVLCVANRFEVMNNERSGFTLETQISTFSPLNVEQAGELKILPVLQLVHP